MIQRYPVLSGMGILAVIAALIAGALMAIPSQAAPRFQVLPTPTPYPAANTPYTLKIVGGQDQTLTFSHADADGFTLGETTATSVYPRGMIFALNPTSANGEIQDVILFIRYEHGSGTRAVAAWDEARGAWVAHPWENGDGQPAWTHFTFSWRVRDMSGATVDTEPQAADYSDPTRQWFRMESADTIVYWYGFSEEDPDLFAQRAADQMASTEAKRVAGFGQKISYTPVAVIYGSREGWNEIYGSGISNPTAGGLTSDALGMTVQYAPNRDLEEQVSWLCFTIAHEMTHLYQFDVMKGTRGPNWWTEGQADYFGGTPRPYDERLMNLATLQDLPTISGEVGREEIQADGQRYLEYDMGASFINWLLTNYGGIETHARIVKLMQGGTSLWDAIVEVTGQQQIDLENGWRTYLGAAPLDLAAVNPESALGPAIDPVAQEGDTVTLPSTPPLPPVYEAPGPHEPTSGQCFANTPVTVLQVGSLDGVDYYKVNCMGQIGWMSRDQLVGPG